MDNEKEINPCPWCECEVTEVVGTAIGEYFVICRECRSTGPTWGDRGVAIDAWNGIWNRLISRGGMKGIVSEIGKMTFRTERLDAALRHIAAQTPGLWSEVNNILKGD